MKFWDVLKEVSAQSIRQEADRLYVLALAGDSHCVQRARAAVLGEPVTARTAANAEVYLFCASPPYSDEDEKRLRHADLLVSLPGGPGLTEFRPADTLQVDRVEELLDAILEHRADLRLALARRLPGFRQAAAELVIRQVSRVNAEFAAVSGIGQSIPFLAPLFPAVAGADILMLTKNQALMIFRLAAIYGEDLGLKARAREVAPVIGGALGWRTLARQLLGVLPGAMGLPVRAGIAFSGTYAVGRAAQMLFDEGRRPTRREMARIYEEGARLAQDAIAYVRQRLGRREETGAPKALPAETETASEPSQAAGIPAREPARGPEAGPPDGSARA